MRRSALFGVCVEPPGKLGVVACTHEKGRRSGGSCWRVFVAVGSDDTDLDEALVQLSLRGKWEDIFWFTFFHESGHVALHRKKELFVDGLTPRSDSRSDEWARLEDERTSSRRTS